MLGKPIIEFWTIRITALGLALSFAGQAADTVADGRTSRVAITLPPCNSYGPRRRKAMPRHRTISA
jgi:hypothetical protein